MLKWEKYELIELLTFQSPFRHYHLPQSHIIAFITATASTGCISIIIALQLIIDLGLGLVFVGVINQCLLFDVRLGFERFNPFIQVIQYEWFIPFNQGNQLVIELFTHVITQDDAQLLIGLLILNSLNLVGSPTLCSLSFYFLLSLLG